MATNPLSRPACTSQTLSVDDGCNSKLWDSLVDSAAVPDVYYRSGYVRAYQGIGHVNAVGVLVETRAVRALFPLLLKPLNTLSFAPNEPGFDAASPYGYGGVLLLDNAHTVSGHQASELIAGLRDWCIDNQVVAAHIRLHPVLNQASWFADTLDEGLQVHHARSTVAIDLSRWHTETSRIATLDKGRRSDLTYARRRLRITWASGRTMLGDDLQNFRALYEARMTELDAGDYYHFPADYYRLLAEGLGSRLDLAIAWLDDSPVGAALFMVDNVMAHYHLSATNDLGRNNKATTLFINAAAERVRARGCERLHLGGGAHGDDKLFAFKRSFGGDMYRYSYLSLICHPLRYRNLVERRVVASGLPAVRSNYFPEYRA